MIDLIAKAKDVCSTNHKTWTKLNEPIRSRSLSSNHTSVNAGIRIVQAKSLFTSDWLRKWRKIV